MSICVYTTANGTRYIKVIRQHKNKTKQTNIRVPKDADAAKMAELLTKAKKIEMELFPHHPEADFLEWYWNTGKPKCIYLDGKNLRLVIQKTLVKGVLAKKIFRSSVGIARTGINPAVAKITDDFWNFHGEELINVDKAKFQSLLTTWLTVAITK